MARYITTEIEQRWQWHWKKGETEEKETQGDEADNSRKIELTIAFQSYSKLEAYTTKYMANNKRAKLIIEFQDNKELILITMIFENKQDANEGDNNLEINSVVRQLFAK